MIASNKTKSESSIAPPSVARRRRRWTYLLIAIALSGVMCWVFRSPILRGVAGFFDVSEALRPTTYIVLLRGEASLNEVERLYRQGLSNQVILLGRPPRRLQRFGILPSETEVIRRELERRGIAVEQVTVLPCSNDDGWNDLRELGTWLAQRPEASVTALTAQLDARTYRHRMRAVMPEAVWDRIHLHGVPDPLYDTSNWWKRKQGVVSLFSAFVRYGYDVCHGEDDESRREWEPREFGKQLR